MGPRGVKLKGSGVSVGDGERVWGTVRAGRASPVYFNIAELYTYEGLKQCRLCCIHLTTIFSMLNNQRKSEGREAP